MYIKNNFLIIKEQLVKLLPHARNLNMFAIIVSHCFIKSFSNNLKKYVDIPKTQI